MSPALDNFSAGKIPLIRSTLEGATKIRSKFSLFQAHSSPLAYAEGS